MHVIQNTQNQKSKIKEGGRGDVTEMHAVLSSNEKTQIKDTLHVYPFLLTDQTGIPTHLVIIETRV